MNLSKKKIKNDFGRAAENYEQYADLQRSIAEKTSKHGWGLMNPEGVILDVGSGTGFVKQLLKPANIMQLDISENMCKKAAHLAPTINGDMDQLPITHESLDGIISSLTIQWAMDTNRVFDEFFRVLKPGSPFAIATFGIHTLQELKSIFRIVDPYTHVNMFLDPLELKEKAKQSGFSNIKIKTDLIIKEYKDVMQLMHSMKKIGAANKHSDRKKHFSGREYFSKIDKLYRSHFGRNVVIPATWEVLYMTGTKP